MDQDSKKFGAATCPTRTGAVRVHGWQAHPVRLPPEQFGGMDAYLVKLNYELETTPGTPEMNWFELGVELRTASVVDAVPHHTQATQDSVSYVVNEHLNFVPATNGTTPAVHLPAAGETIHAFGVGSGGVRWQHLSTPGAGVRPGSRGAWLVTLVEQGATHLDVTAIVRFDLRPMPDWNVLPSPTPLDLRIELLSMPSLRSEPTTQHAERATAALRPAGPRVFISYAHDDDAHKQLVRDFANLLIRCGLDVRLDQFAAPRRKDWYLWAIDNIDNAEFVIIIASPKCRAVGEGKIDRNAHPGMHCELTVIRDRLQENRKLWEQKVLPVVLPGELVSNIPVFLQPRAMDRYSIDELTEDGVGDLMATIHHGVEHDGGSPIVLRTTKSGHALADS
jgi:hypothetical protein